MPLVVKCDGESEEAIVEGGIIVRLWGFRDGLGGTGGGYVFCKIGGRGVNGKRK